MLVSSDALSNYGAGPQVGENFNPFHLAARTVQGALLLAGMLQMGFVPRSESPRLDELPYNALPGVQSAGVLHEFCLALSVAP